MSAIQLPEPVFRLAEAKAKEFGIPVEQFVAEIVEERLREPSKWPDKPWMECFGGLKHLHD